MLRKGHANNNMTANTSQAQRDLSQSKPQAAIASPAIATIAALPNKGINTKQAITAPTAPPRQLAPYNHTPLASALPKRLANNGNQAPNAKVTGRVNIPSISACDHSAPKNVWN